MAGLCSQPIRLRGEVIDLTTGEITERKLKVACKDRRASVCRACSERYETDAWIIAASGINGGKGIPESVAFLPRLFVTVTAPSFGAVHSINEQGTCAVYAGGTQCPHGVPTRCRIRHQPRDPLLGHPICDPCFDADGAILWNAHSSRLWSRTIQLARRNLAAEAGLSQRTAQNRVTCHYLKVVELQQRGLVHFHALARLDQIADSIDLGTGQLARAMRQAISNVVLEDSGRQYRWGRVADVQELGLSGQDARSVSTYLAKYVTKTASGSLELAYRFQSRRQIRRAVEDPHLCRLAIAAWDLSFQPEYERLALRRHAHTLGYRGHFLTKSRAYSTTFGALRRARAAFMAEGLDDQVEATYTYDGRGHDDERSTELADVLAQLGREQRMESRKKAKEDTNLEK